MRHREIAQPVQVYPGVSGGARNVDLASLAPEPMLIAAILYCFSKQEHLEDLTHYILTWLTPKPPS